MHIFTAASFRGFEKSFKDAHEQAQHDLKQVAAQHRQDQVKRIVAGDITDEAWDDLLQKARHAAEHGAKEYLLLRFPSEVCTDESRAINNPPNPSWPTTLRGEAAALYARWHAHLRPLGFNLSAQVLDFPDGKPGDVGLMLKWGESF